MISFWEIQKGLIYQQVAASSQAQICHKRETETMKSYKNTAQCKLQCLKLPKMIIKQSQRDATQVYSIIITLQINNYAWISTMWLTSEDRGVKHDLAAVTVSAYCVSHITWTKRSNVVQCNDGVKKTNTQKWSLKLHVFAHKNKPQSPSPPWPCQFQLRLYLSINLYWRQSVCICMWCTLWVCVCVLCLSVLPSNSWDIYRYSFHCKARGAREQSIGLRSHGN